MSSQLLPSIISAILLSASVDGASAFVSPPSYIDSCILSTPFQTQHQLTQSSLRPLNQEISSRIETTTHPTSCLYSSSGGFGSQKKKKVRSANTPASTSKVELFELQELRAQLETIRKDNILYQSLSPEKREELTKYVNAIVEKTDSPIDFCGKSGNTMGIAQFVAGVENKSWRMVFSTDSSSGEEGTAGGLPFGSTVIFRIGEFVGTDGTLDYVLKFSKKVMGLNELNAKSSCSVDIGPVNPGLFTFKYEDIKTNVFGVSNLPVGFFGLLKGRVNYIDTVWFDGERWIERNYLENGDVVYSVYVRDVDDEKLANN